MRTNREQLIPGIKTHCPPLAGLLAGVIILGGCWPAFAGTLTLKSSGSSATPAIIGYNHGYFTNGGNCGLEVYVSTAVCSDHLDFAF